VRRSAGTEGDVRRRAGVVRAIEKECTSRGDVRRRSEVVRASEKECRNKRGHEEKSRSSKGE
jgi:hypothetical protein